MMLISGSLGQSKPLSIRREEHMQSTVAAVTAELSNRAVILVSDQMLKALDEWR